MAAEELRAERARLQCPELRPPAPLLIALTHIINVTNINQYHHYEHHYEFFLKQHIKVSVDSKQMTPSSAPGESEDFTLRRTNK